MDRPRTLQTNRQEHLRVRVPRSKLLDVELAARHARKRERRRGGGGAKAIARGENLHGGRAVNRPAVVRRAVPEGSVGSRTRSRDREVPRSPRAGAEAAVERCKIARGSRSLSSPPARWQPAVRTA